MQAVRPVKEHHMFSNNTPTTRPLILPDNPLINPPPTYASFHPVDIHLTRVPTNPPTKPYNITISTNTHTSSPDKPPLLLPVIH